MSISIFIRNFVCVLTNERYKHIRRDLNSVALGVGLWGAGGAEGVKKIKHCHVAYQIVGDDKQNKMQDKFFPRVKLVAFGLCQKVKYH